MVSETKGWPPARVVWLQGNEVVDKTYHTEGNLTVNLLDVPASRQDLIHPFICTANNNDVTPSLLGTYQRNVTCGPLSVKILAKDTTLIVHRQTRFECVVYGSNPPPKVSWYINNNQVERYVKTIHRGNKTISKLDLQLRREHHRNQLICRARNKFLPKETMEDILTLNVAYKPFVTLSLGRNLDPSELRESIDVFFECKIDANPFPYKVQWFHDGVPLVHNVSAGVVMSENSVALQRVSRTRSGRYQCSASNVEGDAVSNNITIKIKYAPRCAVAPSLRGVALGELTNVTCTVDADPPEVTFKWDFNNSVRKDTSENVSSKKFTEEGLQSVLSYTPLSERDYGTLFCYATNSVGHQQKPCSFTVISAGPPEHVNNCTTGNLTSHSVGIWCEEGFDGGLPQNFLLQVFEARTGEVVFNASSLTPTFTARPLEPGTLFHASITSFNSRGRSSTSSLRFRTLREATMHKILPSKVEPSPLVWVSGVIFGIIFVVAVLLFVVWVVKKRQPYPRGHPTITTTVVVKENNPDLINMEGSEERLSEIGDPKVSPEDEPHKEKVSLFDNQGATHTQSSRPINREGVDFSPYDEAGGDSSLFVSGSPDTNEKTRLTSPRGCRRDRRSKPSLELRKQTIVRLHQDCGPESTF